MSGISFRLSSEGKCKELREVPMNSIKYTGNGRVSFVIRDAVIEKEVIGINPNDFQEIDTLFRVLVAISVKIAITRHCIVFEMRDKSEFKVKLLDDTSPISYILIDEGWVDEKSNEHVDLFDRDDWLEGYYGPYRFESHILELIAVYSNGYRTTLAEAILASLGSEFTLTHTADSTGDSYVLTCDRQGKLYAEMRLPELKTIKSIKAGQLAVADIVGLVKEIKTESHVRLYDRFLAMLFNTGYNIEVEKNKLYLPGSEEAAFTWKGDFILLYKLNELEPTTKVYWTPNSIMVRDGLEIRNNAKCVTIVYAGYRVEIEDEQKH